MQSASATLKRVTLELGGNDAAIVLPDADVAALAEQLFWAAFTNNGQICIATKRMYVHRDVYEPLKEALIAYARTVQTGDGAQQGVRLGPINNHLQYERVLDSSATRATRAIDSCSAARRPTRPAISSPSPSSTTHPRIAASFRRSSSVPSSPSSASMTWTR